MTDASELGHIRLNQPTWKRVPTRDELADALRAVRARKWTGLPFDPEDEELERHIDDLIDRLP